MLVKIAIFLLRSPQISTPCQPSLRAKNGDGLNSIKLFQFDVKYDSQTYMEKSTGRQKTNVALWWTRGIQLEHTVILLKENDPVIPINRI